MMKLKPNRRETIRETAQRNRETIPYVHPKRFRTALARAAPRFERAARSSGCAPLEAPLRRAARLRR